MLASLDDKTIKKKKTYLTPSRAGSENKQSDVGLPGKRARRIDPSGSTTFFNSSKLCFPGASLLIKNVTTNI
jgi:hypothetical protein